MPFLMSVFFVAKFSWHIRVSDTTTSTQEDPIENHSSRW